MMLGVFPLRTPDAARYAEIPREMIASGHYLTPFLDGIKYFEKPPLFYWLQAANLKLFGVSVLAANLANALMAMLTCLLTYLAASSLYSRLSGFLSALVLATSMIFFAMSHITTLDMAFTFFLSTAFFCFLLGARAPPHKSRYWFWGMYIAMGIAVMTKGLIGIIFPAAIIFLWVLVFNKWRTLKNYYLFSGVLLFLLVIAPWHIYMFVKYPEFFHFYVIEQHFLRYLTPYAGREQAWWFLPLVLVLGFYPWTFFLPQSIKNFFSSYTANSNEWRTTAFLILWSIFVYAFYAFSHSLLIPYMLPILPPLAIAVGHYFANQWEAKQGQSFSWGFYGFAAFNIILALSLILVLPLLGIAGKASFVLVFFVLALLLCACGIFSALSYRFFGVSKGFIVLASMLSLFLLSASPLLYIINARSVMPLAMYLKPLLSPNDIVASYRTYYQDLPYYLERRVAIVNYTGELMFGMQHQDVRDWVLDENSFWSSWKDGKKKYIFMSVHKYKALPLNLKKSVFIIARAGDELLVTNKL